MELWDNFMASKLPDELRAEVLKTKISEIEKTKRTKITDRDHNLTQRFIYICSIAVFIVGCVTAYNIINRWADLKVQEIRGR